MKYLSKSKFLLPTFILAFFSCAPLQNGPKPSELHSAYPVSVKIAEDLRQLLKVERLVVVPEKDKYVVQFTVKSSSDTRLNFLYRVLIYNKQGLVSEYLTEKWNVASLDPYGERNFEVIVPKKIPGNISRIEVILKPFSL
jgi:hypothetical protein